MPLTFTIDTAAGEKEYTVPPVGWLSGEQLALILTADPEKAAKSKTTTKDLFALALSQALWDQLQSDGAEYVEMFRLGMAALARFRMRLDGVDEDKCTAAFDEIRKSGIDPEALAALAANSESSTTSPRTAAAASSTKRPASTSGTRTPRKPASRSARKSSSRSGR